MSGSVRKRLLTSSILALIAGAMLAAAFQLNFLGAAQVRSSDFLFQLRAGEVARSTVIVGVDERSYRTLLPRYGAMFNWPRTLYARALDSVSQAGARVVAFDMFFDAPKPEDGELAAAIRRSGNVIMPVEAQGPRHFHPLHGVAQEFAAFVRPTTRIREAAAAEGLMNVTTDPDTVVRSLPLLLRAGNEVLPALALTSVARFVRRPTVLDMPATDETVYGAGRAIPLVETGSMLINFLGPPSVPDHGGPFRIIPLIDVLNGAYDRALVNDRIVLIGLTIRGLDEFSTPMTDQTRMWGVEVLANAVETILNQRYLTPVPRTVTIGLIFLLALLAAWLAATVRPVAATIGMLGLFGMYLLTAGILFESGTVLNLVYPPGSLLLAFTGTLVYRVVFEQAEQARLEAEQARLEAQRETLMQLFSKHVSPEVAEAAWNQRDQFLEDGRPRSQKLMVTVLFLDFAGFSTASENMDPQTLMSWINSYMEVHAKLVMDHGGVVDDYFGDGMKADFGVPLPRTTDAEIRRDAMNAVNCALDMEKEMIRLNALSQERQLPAMRMRVGIFTGHVVAGSIGSAKRLKYTTLGDTVNTASRLESFDKDLVLPNSETSPCRILIGETTLHYLDDHFQTLRLGEVSLKGKHQTVTAYCVLGRREPIHAAEREGLS